MGRIRQVRKHDGTLVGFRERKVADAILSALAAGGVQDRALAEELAGVVLLFLEKHNEGDCVASADVEEMIRRVLQETGHERSARCFEETQHRRKLLRRNLIVRAPRGSVAGLVERETSGWSRDRLVRSLIRRREIPESLAEEIATGVELRLMRAELESVSTALIAELVDHELETRGLDPGREREAVYGVRHAELVRAVRGQPASGVLPDRAIASVALRSFALTDLHGAATARAHDEGRIHVHGLDDPSKLERLILPSAAIFPGGEMHDLAAGLLRARSCLEALSDHVRSEILLPDLAATLARSAPAGDDLRLFGLLLDAVDLRDAYGSRRGPRPRLWIPVTLRDGGSPQRRLVAGLLELLRKKPEALDRVPMTLIVDPAGDEDGLAALAELLEPALPHRGIELRIAREGDPRALPGPVRWPVPVTVSIARVALNLPLALEDGSGGDLNAVLAHLESSTRLCLEAFTERFWFQRGGAVQGLHAIVEHLGGPGQVQITADGQEVDLEIWGLAHALELLVRRRLIARPERARVAARILGFIDYFVGDEHGGVRFNVRLGGTEDREVRGQLLESLARVAQRYARSDLQEVLETDAEAARSLPVVVPVLSEANRPLLEAPFAERLGPGLGIPLAALGEGPPAELLRRAAAETRLARLELAPQRSALEVFEVQEELFGER